MKYLLLCSFSVLMSCISYDAETERKFQENKAFMYSYLEELGYKNSPFLIRLPSDQSDQQKKKMIALLSKEEIKTFVDKQTSGVPLINNDLPRSKEFLELVDGMKPEKAYDILVNTYPELLVIK